MHPSPSNSLASPGSENPRFTEARTLAEHCGPFLVDASDIVLIESSDDDFDESLDDPLERYPDGEFDE